MELPPLAPDSSTIELWKARNDPRQSEAFMALYGWIRDEVRRHSGFAQLRGCSDSDDLATEVILRGLRDPRLISGDFEARAPGALRAYLRSFVDSVVVDALRHRFALKRGAGRPAESLSGGESGDGPPQPRSHDPTPSQQSIARELDGRVLALLDEAERELYRLHAVDGQTFAEIAHNRGESESAARSRYHRIAKKLEGLL